MRVCLLAQASPATWVAHYAAAFRRVCDTLVIGPSPTPEKLAAWGRAGAANLIVPNDISCDFEREPVDLMSLLPAGWTPDLVVGIAGVGGDPLYPRVAELPCPSVFISVDTWQCLLDYREALRYDLVFVAQREFAEHLRAAGSRHVFWLPLACDPEAHHPAEAAQAFDIAFAGSASAPVHRERRRLLEALSRRFTLIAREQVFGEELCTLLAQGRLVFNHSAVQELNMRIFEALGMGCALLTNREADVNGLTELFDEDKHLIVYDSEADLMEKAAQYLADDKARGAIAAAGRAEALARHTYTHRVQTILDTVAALMPASKDSVVYPGESLGEALAPVEEARYCGDHISAYLPTLPGVVVDYGLGLDASKVALRRKGVTRLIGLAIEPGVAAARRRGAYDELLPFAAAAFSEADTVVIAAPETLGAPLDEALRRAHALLRPGGTLALGLRGALLDAVQLKPAGDALSPWLEAADFHLRLLGSPLADGGCILLARKRTKCLTQIVEDVFSRLHVPEMDLPELLRRIPAGW